eukprot:1794741-Pyramimonas_sp.AAC.1
MCIRDRSSAVDLDPDMLQVYSRGYRRETHWGPTTGVNGRNCKQLRSAAGGQQQGVCKGSAVPGKGHLRWMWPYFWRPIWRRSPLWGIDLLKNKLSHIVHP